MTVSRVGGAVIGERPVFAAGQLADFAHVACHDIRHFVIDPVAGFRGLEVDVAVLGGAPCDGGVRIQGTGAERLQRLLADHLAEVVLVQRLDLLDFMRGAETVEEVEERDAGLDGRQVRDRRHVLGFLDGTRRQQREAGLAARHHVLVVSEDGEGVAGEGAGAHVEHGGQHFTGNLVHVGNHQEKALRCRKGGSEGTSLQGTMHGTGGTGLALHLRHFHGFSPEVLFSVSSPLVNVLGHGGRGRDRVDGGVLAEQVSDVRGGIVTITGDEFLFFSHN